MHTVCVCHSERQLSGRGCLPWPLLRYVLLTLSFVVGVDSSSAQGQQFPDQRTVAADLQTPAAVSDTAAAGRRILFAPDPDRPQLLCTLWLPTDWTPQRSWPVFAELPGNGGYRNAFGDECSGRAEDCNLGYGLTEGRGWIWLCLPFLNGDGSQVALTWWGQAPDYQPDATLQYWQLAVQTVCSRFHGDSNKVVLAGFSRGAIACNALGLHNEQVASLWAAFLPCSHYDGVRQWPFAGSDQMSAARRFQRLANRPQLILGEGLQTEETARYLRTVLQAEPAEHGLQLHSTGFVNHSDQWALRPCKARDVSRRWLQEIATQR